MAYTSYHRDVKMEISDGAIVESEDGGYPFDQIEKLRENAGAFMRHALSDNDDDMDDEPYVVTPDYTSFDSYPAPALPQEQQIRPDPIAFQPTATSEFQIDEMPDSKDKPSLVRDSKNAFSEMPKSSSTSTTSHHLLHHHTSIETTSHCNHHFGFQTMTSTSRVPAAMIPRQQRSSPVKKSKSIQIRKSRRGSSSSDDFASSSVSSSAEQMYDWATWRMYHRITTARRNKAAVAPLQEENANSSRMFRGVVPFPLNRGESSPRKKESTTTTPEQRNDFDEGIFVMDL